MKGVGRHGELDFKVSELPAARMRTFGERPSANCKAGVASH